MKKERKDDVVIEEKDDTPVDTSPITDAEVKRKKCEIERNVVFQEFKKQLKQTEEDIKSRQALRKQKQEEMQAQLSNFLKGVKI
ncbi:MAG: hypothetical protein LBH46_04360 [Rickettsiales bacterium]|jgi:flagellar motor switch protein FliM|nr:hypothetical protein [Rickettsiales bacterium]